MKTIKIFISSPGDVLQERMIAKRVISELNDLFSSYVKLEALLWEDMPLLATESFQEGIDMVAGVDVVDIAVFILWSRLGSPLGKSFRKPDGSLYASGTEYEFDMMYSAFKKTGHPSILTYIKNASIKDSLAYIQSEDDIKEALNQQIAVKNFILENFVDPKTDTNYAYLEFDHPETFEQRLTLHLKQLILRKIGENVVLKEWTGNPYVGLDSFSYEQSPIFCGRKRVVNEITAKLLKFNKGEIPSLIIMGQSGCGKSSLLKAGILPNIVRGLNDKAQYYPVYILPSRYSGNIYEGIVADLVSGFAIEDKSIFYEGKKFVTSSFIQYVNSQIYSKIPIFVFDQFEELFTDPLITEGERIETIQLLKELVTSHKLWLFFSMRSDFYYKFSTYAQLSALKDASIVYDVPQMQQSDYQEIVEEPARKAGLKWEINTNGIGLNKEIINDLSSFNDLPLVEFALSELYDKKTEDELLTFAAYDEIGRLKGAIIHYLNHFYDALDENEKQCFYHILGSVITPSSANRNLYVKKTVLLSEITKKTETAALVHKLVAAHIFVSDKNSFGESTITLAHEMLINSWNVISQWIEHEKYFIEMNDHYENLSQYWIKSQCSEKELIRDKNAIKELEYFLYSWGESASSKTLEYGLTSIKKHRRKFLLGYICALIISLFCIVSAIYSMMISNPLFEDFMKTSDIVDLSILDVASLYLLVVVYLVYTVYIKALAKPSFVTIKRSLYIWGVIWILAIIDYINTLVTSDYDLMMGSLGVCLPLAATIKYGSLIYRHYEIKKWNKRSFKRVIKLNNTFSKVKSVLVYFTILLTFFMGACVWGIYMWEKAEKLSNSITIIDELFDGLNNVQPRLLPSDNIYINEKRLAYLTENFSDQLKDTIIDQRDYQYALCQYNLGYPEYVTHNLDFDYYSNVRLGILAYFELGRYDLSRQLIDLYIKYLKNSSDRTFAEFDTQYIWSAEKMGDFEFAKDVYAKLDSIGFDYSNDMSYMVNYAHILLMEGRVEEASEIYASQFNFSNGLTTGKKEIEKDFAILTWFGISDENINKVAKCLNLNLRPQYTSVDDWEKTTEVMTPFMGKWRCEENGMYIYWDISNDYHLCHYTVTDSIGVKTNVAVTGYRARRCDDDYVVMDEFDSRANTLATDLLTLLNDSIMFVHIIDNGVDTMKGMERVYKRISDDE